MATINKKLIHFRSLSDFEARLAAGDVLSTSIVWIKDAKKIWTHGTYYDCNGGGDNVYIFNPDGVASEEYAGLQDAVNNGKMVAINMDGLTTPCILIPRESGIIVQVELAMSSTQESEASSYVLSFNSMSYLVTEDGIALYNTGAFILGGGDGTQVLTNSASYSSLKTINGESILGSGDITIEGGSDITVDDTLNANSTNPVQNKAIVTALTSIAEVSNSAVQPDDLATVATSGSYNDLSDKPTIPSVVTPDWIQNDSSEDDYIKSRTHYVNGVTISAGGTYSVGTSVTQLYFKGTFFDLVVNEQITLLSGPPVYATINSAGILTVTDAGGYLGAYPLIAVRSIVPLADMYIPNTVVRTSGLKTINNQSLIGSGNITISGGSGGSSAYSEVSHGTSDTTFTLTPNVFHVWDEVSSLTLTLGNETAGVANEFLFQFNSGSEATTLSLPDTIKWANDSAPTIEANKIYQISVLKGLASALVFDNTPKIATISFKIRNFECIAEEGMTWEQWVSSEYNTTNCSLMGNNIQRMGEIIGTSGTVYVTKTDIIISDFVYSLIPMT